MRLRPVLLLQSPTLPFVQDLRGLFRVREVDSWEGLARALPLEHPTTVVVLDPYDTADEPSREFWELLGRFPSTAVVSAFESRPERVGHMRGMVRAGVSEFLNLEREHTPALAATRIRSACARPFKRRIESGISPRTGVEARTMLTAAAEVAVRGEGPPEMARMFGVTPKTLTAWCTAHGLPLPRRLLAWTRILLAAHLLEDAGRTRAAVAAACGYRTDRSLRRIIQRFVAPEGRDPLFDAALRAFNAELRQCREDVRSAGPNVGRVANPMQDGTYNPTLCRRIPDDH